MYADITSRDSHGGRESTELLTPVPSAPEVAAHETNLLRTLLCSFDAGLLVATDDARVVAMNPAAGSLLSATDAVCATRGTLPFIHGQSLHCWNEALSALCSVKARILEIRLGARKCTIAVSAMPYRWSGRSLYLVSFAKPALVSSVTLDYLGRTHNLTPSECEVLRMLGEGRVPKQIAHARSVSLATVRSQIRSVLGKTGAQSISSLLLRLASLPEASRWQERSDTVVHQPEGNALTKRTSPFLQWM